jgi:DNA polymerase-3 subunit beta
MGAQVEEEGKTTVSARKLLEVIREVPQDLVAIEALPNNRLLIRAGRSRFELSTIAAEDFPKIEAYQDLPLAKFEAEQLRRALQKTAYSIPSEEDAFTAPGLLWHPAGDAAYRFVSSDGHRLAYFETQPDAFPGVQLKEGGILIPRKAVQEMARVLEREADAEIGLDEKSLVLRTPDSFLSTLLLDADFPEYEAIIPAERPSGFVIEKDVLQPALKRVSVLADADYKHVRFNISQNSLELESGNPEQGHANDVLDIDYSGDDFSIAFNVRYVLETVQAMDSPLVRFEWVDQFHGGIFLGPDDPGYLSLIMPMVM